MRVYFKNNKVCSKQAKFDFIWFVLTIVTLFLSIRANASEFNKKHYEVIKDVVWAADKAEIPRALLLGVCYGESNFNVKRKLTHKDGKTLSYGVCQVKLETAQWMDKYCHHKVKITAKRLENVKVNSFYAAKLLKYQLKQYNNNWQLAVDAYNKGTAISKNTKYVKNFRKYHKFLSKQIPELMK